MTSYTATVSPKGQVTVPNEVRERMHLRPGDRVEFQLLRDGSAVFRVMTATVDDLFGAIAYTGPVKSIDEINEGIAQAAAGFLDDHRNAA